MAEKKSGRRTVKKRAAPAAKATQKKITLPAFGLADEILGARSADAGAGETARAEAPLPQPAPAAGGTSIEADRPGVELHLVTFFLDREEYGVDIGAVQEVIRVGQIAIVPHAPSAIRGVINLRGKVLPVLDLRKRLELPPAALTKNSRIMVVESGRSVLGMLVDGVSQVVRIPATAVDEPPHEEAGGAVFVRGIGKVDARLIMIMDLAQVLAKEEQQAAGRPAVYNHGTA